MKVIIAIVGLLPVMCLGISTESRYIGLSEAGQILDLRYVSSHYQDGSGYGALIFTDTANENFKYCRAQQSEAPENEIIECLHFDKVPKLIIYKRNQREEENASMSELIKKKYGENWLYFSNFECVTNCSKLAPATLYETFESENEDVE